MRRWFRAGVRWERIENSCGVASDKLKIFWWLRGCCGDADAVCCVGAVYFCTLLKTPHSHNHPTVEFVQRWLVAQVFKVSTVIARSTSATRPEEVPLGYDNPYSPWYALRYSQNVQGRGLPHQCAHWFAMTEKNPTLRNQPSAVRIALPLRSACKDLPLWGRWQR